MFDNICKFLAQTFSSDFATWLLGEPISFTELKPTELSLEPIRADSLILLQSEQIILHLEFQTRPDPNMGFMVTSARGFAAIPRIATASSIRKNNKSRNNANSSSQKNRTD